MWKLQAEYVMGHTVAPDPHKGKREPCLQARPFRRLQHSEKPTHLGCVTGREGPLDDAFFTVRMPRTWA